ncbi:MAG: DUF4440 domain-containing protein [Acidobacteria bacterium]|nr:DUF4440 domain-containing protein [Acidobacteriota bacterium]
MNFAKHPLPAGAAFSAFLFLVVTAACGPTPQQQAPEQAISTAAEAESIRTVESEYDAALNADDMATMARLMADDAVLMPPNRSAVKGMEAIAEFQQASIGQQALQIVFGVEEVVAAGDWAVLRYTYSGTQTLKADGQTRPVNGKGLTIFQRQPGGPWKIARRIWNASTSPASLR